MSTQEAVRHVEGEVRELIRRSGLDPASDTKAVRRLVQDAVQDYDERSLHGGLPSLGDHDTATARSNRGIGDDRPSIAAEAEVIQQRDAATALHARR